MSKKRKLNINFILLVLLIVALITISYALTLKTLKERNNYFQTGNVEIDLNNGEPVITADEFLFEPGITVEKPFYIQNNGTWPVYYKLYFAQIEGNLSDVLNVTILSEAGSVLVAGKLSALTRANVPTLEDNLGVQERKNLTIRFHFPEEAGNEAQRGSLTFVLSADSVQTKNNPDKEFN